MVVFAAMLSFGGEVWQGKCVGVADGDTATILLEDKTQIKVRFWGIDAPEKSQDFGQVAKKKLSDLIFDKKVRVVVQNKDRYQRYVAKVYVGRRYVNKLMVSEGLAWHYKHYAPDDRDLAKAEQSARKAKKGLWQHKNPTAPWDFRSSSKKKEKRKFLLW